MRRCEFIADLGGAATAWPRYNRRRRPAVSLIAGMQDSNFQTYVRASDINRQLAAVLLILSASLQPSQAAEYLYPGVYLQEGPGPKRIDGVSTTEPWPGTDCA